MKIFLKFQFAYWAISYFKSLYSDPTTNVNKNVLLMFAEDKVTATFCIIQILLSL